MGTKPCTPHGVLARLTELFVRHGPPSYRRSDNGPEFTATAMRSWLRQLGVTTLFIAPGSPWENGYVESLNGKLRDECRNPEIFTTLAAAPILIEHGRPASHPVRPPVPSAPARLPRKPWRSSRPTRPRRSTGGSWHSPTPWYNHRGQVTAASSSTDGAIRQSL